MADETPSEQGKLPYPEGTIDRVRAARMVLDLVHQTMAAAPPRTWVQSMNHPGSRRWLTNSLSGASLLFGRPLPVPAGNTRRTSAINALEALVSRTHSAGTWAQATPIERGHLADLISATPASFPITVERIARSGALPFSEREIARVQRRTHPVT